MEELDDINEEFLVQLNQHRELVSLLKKILSKDNAVNIDLSSLESVVDSVEKLREELKQKELSVNVEAQDISPKIDEIKNVVSNALTEIKQSIEKIQPKEWVFEIERNKITKQINYITAKAN